MAPKTSDLPDSSLIVSTIIEVLQSEAKGIASCVERLRKSTTSVEGGASGAYVRSVSLFQEALVKGGKIVVTGVGKSGKIGQKIAATLCSTGSRAVFLHPTEGMHGDIGIVEPSDVVLALSYTGNTEEILRLVPALRARGVPMVCICGNPQSRLAGLADICLDGAVEHEACPHNLAPTASTTLALAIGDAIAVALMKTRGFEPKSFALNHPGGSLGARLSLKVSDLMHQGDALPTVTSTSSIEEIVTETTRKRLGAVLVISDGARGGVGGSEKVRSEVATEAQNRAPASTLVGLITDGDLRRAMARKDVFFTLRAQDLMTRTPTTISPDAMAMDALKLMEERPSAITVLPVTGPGREVMGIVHIHDLVRAF